MNRKGQSLVLFVLLIPIIIGIMVLIYDVGLSISCKNHMNNVMEMVLDIGLKDNLELSKIEELLNYNLDGYDTKVSYSDDKIIVISSTYVKGVLSKVFGFDGFSIKSKYIGYKRDNKVYIEQE